MNNQELYHWGIKGMRWGRRRFQNKDGSLTPAGRERYDDDDDSSDRKDRAVKSGKASEVEKYKSKMSNEELQRAVNRINLERQLASLKEQEVQSGFDKFSSVMDKVGKVTNGVQRGLDLYNLAAKINNSVNAKKKLPLLDGGQEKSKLAEEARKKFIDNLGPSDLVKYAGTLSAEEIKRISERLDNEDKILKRIP